MVQANATTFATGALYLILHPKFDEKLDMTNWKGSGILLSFQMTIYPIHYSENKVIWISVSDFKTNQLENGVAMAAPGIHHPGITDLGAARHTDLHKEALKETMVF